MKKLTFIALLLALCTVAMQAQTKTESDTAIFKTVEVMPEYPNGQAEMMAFLGKMEYPPTAKQNKQEGTVFLQFIVEKDGSISNVQTVRSSGHPELDETAAAHISTMPKWSPGYQNGRPVRVQYVVPVKFKL